MATLAGMHGSSSALGRIIEPMAFGALSDAFGVGSIFPFGSIVGLLGSGLVIYWLRHWDGSAADPTG